MSSLRRPTALGRAPPKAAPAERTGLGTHGQAGQPGRPAADRSAGAPQSALQRIHQRVSDAAAKARCDSSVSVRRNDPLFLESLPAHCMLHLKLLFRRASHSMMIPGCRHILRAVGTLKKSLRVGRADAGSCRGSRERQKPHLAQPRRPPGLPRDRPNQAALPSRQRPGHPQQMRGVM